jgi:hypothetical protein
MCVSVLIERDSKDRHSKEKTSKRKDKDAVSSLTSDVIFRLSFVGQCQVNS